MPTYSYIYFSELYSEEMCKVINEAIDEVNQALISMKEEPLPLYLYQNYNQTNTSHIEKTSL